MKGRAFAREKIKKVKTEQKAQKRSEEDWKKSKKTMRNFVSSFYSNTNNMQDHTRRWGY